MRLHALRRRSLGRGALRRRRLAAELRVLPIFACRLQTTLVPERANGSGTPTFTRATTAYQTDFEGKLNLALSGEARFQGFRRAHNLVSTKSEDWTNAAWTKTIGTVTATTLTSTGANQTVLQTYTAVSSNWVMRVRMSRITGTGNIQLTLDGGAGWTTVTLTGGNQVFSIAQIGVTNPQFGIRIVTSGDAINADQIGLYNTKGVTNTNPPEYVSVGILSAPFHGANVDGVKYFDTLNGNTVASNVVTEATGAPINSSAAEAAGGVTAGVVDAGGPFGYLAEGAITNVATRSDMASGWGNIIGTVFTANQYVARNGTTTLAKIAASAGNTKHYIQSSANFATSAVPTTISMTLKYVNNRWNALYWDDGITGFVGSFDLLNGVVGAVTANTTSTIAPTALAGVYRVTLTATPAAGSAGTIAVSVNGTDSASLQTWNAVGTEITGAGEAQFEASAFASTYIPTTTVAVARNASVDQYVSAGNIPASNNDFVVYGESAFNPVPTAASYFLWASYVDADNYTAVLWDGTNLIARKRIAAANHDAIIAFTPTAGTAFKWAARFTSTIGTDIFLNGTKGTNDATNTACQIGANFQWSADGNGANQPFGTLRNTWIFDRPRFTQVLVDMTTDGLMR